MNHYMEPRGVLLAILHCIFTQRLAVLHMSSHEVCQHGINAARCKMKSRCIEQNAADMHYTNILYRIIL